MISQYTESPRSRRMSRSNHSRISASDPIVSQLASYSRDRHSQNNAASLAERRTPRSASSTRAIRSASRTSASQISAPWAARQRNLLIVRCVSLLGMRDGLHRSGPLRLRVQPGLQPEKHLRELVLRLLRRKRLRKLPTIPQLTRHAHVPSPSSRASHPSHPRAPGSPQLTSHDKLRGPVALSLQGETTSRKSLGSFPSTTRSSTQSPNSGLCRTR